MANFCDHCDGQRFDRARVLRAERHVRRELRGQRCGRKVDDALTAALAAVARLDVPHLEVDDTGSDTTIH